MLISIYPVMSPAWVVLGYGSPDSLSLAALGGGECNFAHIGISDRYGSVLTNTGTCPYDRTTSDTLGQLSH